MATLKFSEGKARIGRVEETERLWKAKGLDVAACHRKMEFVAADVTDTNAYKELLTEVKTAAEKCIKRLTVDKRLGIVCEAIRRDAARIELGSRASQNEIVRIKSGLEFAEPEVPVSAGAEVETVNL